MLNSTETPITESFFSKVVGYKKAWSRVFSSEYLKHFNKSYFKEHLLLLQTSLRNTMSPQNLDSVTMRTTKN